MSISVVCDICNRKIDEGDYHGRLEFWNYDDHYNSDTHDGKLDICEMCMMHIFSKETIDRNIDV